MSDLLRTKNETPEILLATLNRPEKKNAFNIELLDALLSLLDRVEKDGVTRVIVFNGAGTAFSAGLDLDEARDSALAPVSSEKIAQLLQRIYTSPLITITLAHGAAIAGGAGFMAASDFAVGTPDLKVAFPEVKRGLLPAIVSTFLSRQIRWRHLRELFLLGEVISGITAVEWGLMNETALEAQLHNVGLQYAYRALEGAPEAVRLTKKLMNGLYSKDLQEEMQNAHQIHLDARKSPESLEGILAFKECRKPYWVKF